MIEKELRFDKALRALSAPEVLVLHHEAAPSASVEQVHDYHKGKGWGGIAYVQGVYPGVKIVGHKVVGATACPGKHFPLEEVKSAMARMKTINDVPASLRRETQELIDAGALKGNENGLDVTEDMLRSMIVMKRYIDAKN